MAKNQIDSKENIVLINEELHVMRCAIWYH